MKLKDGAAVIVIFSLLLFHHAGLAAQSEEGKMEKQGEFKKYSKYLSGSFNLDEGKIGVEEGYITLGVKNRNPVHPGTRFKKGVKRLYCFTRVTGAKKPTYITHVWYLNNEKVASVKLKVTSPNFRTYSSKRLPEGFTGKGKCIVYDSEGFNLITLKFEVVEK